jgi:hypothetical protein
MFEACIHGEQGTPTYLTVSYQRVDARWYAVDRITQAVAASGIDVPAATQDAARRLLDLASAKPQPEVVVEESGEISFEWSKDRNHVAVLSVDGKFLRWAGVVGAERTVSGKHLFDGQSIPGDALNVLDQAV